MKYKAAYCKDCGKIHFYQKKGLTGLEYRMKELERYGYDIREVEEEIAIQDSSGCEKRGILLANEWVSIFQDNRIDSCAATLYDMGFSPLVDYDKKSITFLFGENTITLFPYKGWFSGKGIKDGRGFLNLLKQLK